MQTVIFLNEPEDSINKKATISKIGKKGYFVRNLNMPFIGTISEIWSKKDLEKKIRNKEVQVI